MVSIIGSEDHQWGDALEYLNGLAQWTGSGSFSPDNIRRLLSSIGDPQDALPSIHVAGTNGKGSVSSAVASVLGAAGNRVGLTTSPHLSVVNERILVDGYPISDERLGAWTHLFKVAAKQAGLELSFFEAIMAIAFIGFSELDLDYSVIEVGLGGSMDASNVINRPEVSVITSIDFDHEHILGDTLEKIASDKAGIIKPGRPVVVGKMGPKALQAIEEVARSHNAPVYSFGSHFGLRGIESQGINMSAVFSGASGREIKLSPSLPGEHQLWNMAVAAQVCELLGVDSRSIESGIHSVFWPARLESVGGYKREIILDCAHNVAGVNSLAEYLKYRDLKQVSLGVGVLQTKRWKEMLRTLAPFAAHCGIITPDSKAAVAAEEMITYLSGIDLKAKTFGSDASSFLNEELARDCDYPILFAGSMYMVGKVRECVVKETKPVWNRAVKEERPCSAPV